MSDRDDLAEAIFSAMNALPMNQSDHIGIAPEDMRQVADLVLASGWAPPAENGDLRRLHKPIDFDCGESICKGNTSYCEYCLNLSGDHREAPWPCPSSLEVAKLAAENVTLFGENVDLCRQLDDARELVVRSGYFQSDDA